jgi:hypothetical protein
LRAMQNDLQNTQATYTTLLTGSMNAMGALLP